MRRALDLTLESDVEYSEDELELKDELELLNSDNETLGIPH